MFYVDICIMEMPIPRIKKLVFTNLDAARAYCKEKNQDLTTLGYRIYTPERVIEKRGVMRNADSN